MTVPETNAKLCQWQVASQLCDINQDGLLMQGICVTKGNKCCTVEGRDSGKCNTVMEINGKRHS